MLTRRPRPFVLASDVLADGQAQPAAATPYVVAFLKQKLG